MSVNLDRQDAVSLASDLVQGARDINQLNLARANHREALLSALKERPALLRNVRHENEEHFFTFAIKKNYEYFIQLKRNQYTNALAQQYIYQRLMAVEPAEKRAPREDSDIVIQKSLDEKITVTYFYTTPEGEELYYQDPELGVPVALKSNLKISLKIDNAVSLIDKLDTCIEQLGAKKIKIAICDLIANEYKIFINSFIKTKNVGYYSLCTSFDEIEAGYRVALNRAFGSYGISATEIIVRRLAIPKDIQNKIEDLAFKTRQHSFVVNAESALAKASLENYETKLSIQQKYPDAEHSLTEYEKDLALKRYLEKNGVDKDVNVDRSIKLEKTRDAIDAALEKKEDIIPDIPEKKNAFKGVFITFLILSLIADLILFINNVGAGFIVLGVITILFGLIGAFNHERMSSVSVAPDAAKLTHGENSSEGDNV